jgi:nucleotide-binding universal stress UspA family protein
MEEIEMAYKSILTVVTSAAAARVQIDAGVALARREDAHLDVICLGIDRSQEGFYYIGAAPLPPAIRQEEVGAMQEALRATEAAARAQLDPEDIRWATDSIITFPGLIGREIGLRTRFCDLVIMPKPYGADDDTDQASIVEAAIFDGRAPVLLLPHGATDASFGKRIVIAWNQSDEAMVAIRAALPLLKSASVVNIAVIAPSAHDPERSDPGGKLSQFLARHGVRCEVSVLAKTLPRVSDVLCRHASDINADMVVMGAYGHSRLREAILGGTTREMFEIATLPILSAH